MRFGVLGTGTVGRTLASKLLELGHEVRMGSREAGSEKGVEWAEPAGERASQGSFADAAAFGEVVLNATAGAHSLEALEAAGSENLAGKVLVDVANPLELGEGVPTLGVANDDSLAERIQRALPEARVVKALNTVNAGVMVSPGELAEPTDLFICGDDDAAKRDVAELLAGFGWERERIRDLGGISAARGPEMYLPLWLRLWGALDSTRFNVRIVGE